MPHLRLQLQTKGGWTEKRNWDSYGDLAKDRLLCMKEGHVAIISISHHILGVFKSGEHARERVKDIGDILSGDSLYDKRDVTAIFDRTARQLRDSM